jgi:hypothetical protein
MLMNPDPSDTQPVLVVRKRVMSKFGKTLSAPGRPQEAEADVHSGCHDNRG